ncbi:hypothetical protein ADZ36_11995 [Streptomyces fradiae]|uniref:Uncharacterized protein n=1 Tax=Streptomyces fradiae TaxID=1906 RepID=A0ACC4WCD1_STRFR|nr:hypothetical protein ADZ36_11995 [Streptomyces fradiae]OFA56471.1 hypothetical protein BEN35_05800 [Streptomyces fradiae]
MLYASLSVHSRTRASLRSRPAVARSAAYSCGVQVRGSDPVPASRRPARSTSTPSRPRRVMPTTITSSVWLRLTSIWSHPRTKGRPPGW